MCFGKTHRLFCYNASSVQGKRMMRFTPVNDFLSQSVGSLHHHFIPIYSTESQIKQDDANSRKA